MSYKDVKYELVHARAGHVPPFFKSFRSVLERAPSVRSFRSRSFNFQSFPSCSLPSRSVPFLVEERSSRYVPFFVFLVEEWFHHLVPFLVKNVSIPSSVLSQEDRKREGGWSRVKDYFRGV